MTQSAAPARRRFLISALSVCAAASVTAVPRSLASSLSPALSGWLLGLPFAGLPLVICGVLKITYDLGLLYSFRHVRPPEEQARAT